MIDLHTHTFLSDGVLAPAELVRRAEHAGYRVIGIADHADSSNLDAPQGGPGGEPVQLGTNRAGIEAGVDILAHPGLISEEEARMAAENGVHLEVSARFSHGLANGRVVETAREAGASPVIESDAHAAE